MTDPQSPPPAPTSPRTELLREHVPVLLLVLGYTVICLGVQASYGRVNALGLAFSHTALNMISCLLVLVAVSAYAVWLFPSVPADTSPIRWIGGKVRRAFFTERRVLGFLIMHLAIPVFSSTWAAYKLLIPTIQPFVWDAPFSALDRALHLGYDPWRLLMPFLGSTPVTVATNAAYQAWILLMLAILGWQAGSAKRTVRLRFFLTFFLLWTIPGTVVATALSSAGPCYYAAVVEGPNPYDEQFAHLQAIHATTPLPALVRQEELWNAYTANTVQVESGISAMPSMHVCMATLFCLLGFAHSRWIGWPLLVFALWIQLGSVHLGWHYAVDGYLGAAFALGTWWGVGWSMRRLAWAPPDLAAPHDPESPRPPESDPPAV